MYDRKSKKQLPFLRQLFFCGEDLFYGTLAEMLGLLTDIYREHGGLNSSQIAADAIIEKQKSGWKRAGCKKKECVL